jgi:hypothetical protein
LTRSKRRKEKIIGHKPATLTGYRDHAIWSFAAETGARVEEISNLTIEDFHGYELLLNDTKNHESQVKAIGQSTFNILNEYITQYRPDSDSPYLFLTLQGNQMTPRNINKRLEVVMKKLNLGKGSMHMFRVSFATSCVKQMQSQGVINPVEHLRILTGHKSRDMAARYVRTVEESQIRDSYSKCSLIDHYYNQNHQQIVDDEGQYELSVFDTPSGSNSLPGLRKENHSSNLEYFNRFGEEIVREVQRLQFSPPQLDFMVQMLKSVAG